MAHAILHYLRRINRAIALIIGTALLLCAAYVVADIVLRRVGFPLRGGTDIAGYAMAIATSWGMAFTLLELGHVRIDILRSRLAGRLRATLDLVALLALAGTASMIALRAWPVLERSILNNSRSNSALQTPLAWVQAPWFAGWVWFALVAWITFLCALWLVLMRDEKAAESTIGMQNEAEVHS
ncbi:MAG: TRAP transporter small permease subunit [Natronohydrobacter sp.]|nr:TRAP transporter small permease subunit [Natronohydrobacter sp.]